MEVEISRACSAKGGRLEIAYRILVGKSERKRPVRRPRQTWKDSINLDLIEIGCGGVDWIHVV
jgi:hypothetical protein